VTADSDKPPVPAWRLAAALVLVLLVVWLVRPRTDPAPDPAPAREAGQTVTVAYKAPDAARREAQTAWYDGITVRDATAAAFASQWRGAGADSFLESLAGTPNQGADGLNWQFDVNGDYATRSAGATPLRPRDRVLWRLAPYE